MTTAHDIITRALRRINVLAAGETADDEMANGALVALNQMLAGWALQGIRMNLPTLALADTLHIPEDHLTAIVSGLAVQLAPEYGRQVASALAVDAADGKRGLRNAYMVVPTMVADAAYTRRMLGGESF